MPKQAVSVWNRFWNMSRRAKIFIAVGVVVVLGGAYYIFMPRAPVYTFVPVTQGSITETVSLTGNTASVASVSLAFGNSGTIAHVYADVGSQVAAGQTLAELNTSDLAAQLAQAQANVDAQSATLAGLKAGAQPEDIAASQAALQKAQQDLANMYASISDAAIDAQSKANDAVRTQLNPFFSNAESATPQLTFVTSNSQAGINAQSERFAASSALNAWQAELSSAGSSPQAAQTLLADSLSYFSSIRMLLQNVSTALDGATSLDSATLAADKAAVADAQAEVNLATKNLNTISQTIASQILLVSQTQAQLALKQAGSTPSAIAAQQAQVEQAQASVASVEAQLQNSRIVAPIAGTVTQFDAKVGQLASPSVPLVSVMGSGGFEVDAGVAETDIGKVALGNAVSMTLDAFPGDTFTGKVFYIAPAETITQGVVDYQVKIAFDTADPRMKSGLTANIDIATRHKDGVLILPQYAILENDSGTFVEIVQSGKVVQMPVTLGLQDQNGNVEIVSGVTAGEQVLNIGLKQS
jgi:HlyD family secretion protein